MARTKQPPEKASVKFKESATSKGKRKRDDEEGQDDDDPITTVFETYITVKIHFPNDKDFISTLRKRYHYFLSTLQLADENAVLLSVNPDRAGSIPTIQNPDSLPSRMTALTPYFTSTTKANRQKAFNFWANARIGHDIPWEDLVETTTYDLHEIQLQLMKKRVQCFKSVTLGYLIFVNNQTDPLDLVAQIEEDIDGVYDWTLYNKKP